MENTFTVSRQHQAYLETHTCLVWIDGQGRVQIWASCKVPYAIKQQLSAALGLPEERIRLNPVSIGGDFGGKGSPMNIPLTYFLAVRTGRPVKMVMEWVEEFIAGNPRHAALIQMKTGVKQDGTLVAHQARVLFNSGAYGGFKPAPGVNLGGASKSGGPYKIPHMHIEGVQVYTNTVPGGFMRAPGEPQAVFAAESQMDLVAARVGNRPYFRVHLLPAKASQQERTPPQLEQTGSKDVTEGHAPTQDAEATGRTDTSRAGSQTGETPRVRTPTGPDSRAQGIDTAQHPGKKGQGQAPGHLYGMRGSPHPGRDPVPGLLQATPGVPKAGQGESCPEKGAGLRTDPHFLTASPGFGLPDPSRGVPTWPGKKGSSS